METAKDLPEQLLELAIAGGATAAEIYIANSTSHPVTFEANRLKQLESTESQGLSLRVWKEGKPGLAVAHGAVEAQALVDRALALSALNEPQEIFLNTSIPAGYPKHSGIQAGLDVNVDVDIEQLLAWGKEAIAQVLDAYPDVICEAQWDSSQETTRLVNSLGLDCSYTDTSVDAYVSAEWIRGDDFLNVWCALSDRIALPPERLVAPVLQRLQWASEPAIATPGKTPILITPKASDLLWGAVVAAMSGRQVEQQSSPWMDKRGQQVLAPGLTLTQQPTQGPYALPFDDEGTPTQPFTWIDRGVLQGFYGDLRTAKLLDLPLLGNGFRGDLGSYPQPGMFNVAIAPGDTSWSELVASLQNGLIVDRLLGSGADLSGDFSVNVELGYWVRNGEIVGRVKDTMVSGNAYQVLNHLAALGSDGEWQGAMYLPSMVVDGVSVTTSLN